MKGALTSCSLLIVKSLDWHEHMDWIDCDEFSRQWPRMGESAVQASGKGRSLEFNVCCCCSCCCCCFSLFSFFFFVSCRCCCCCCSSSFSFFFIMFLYLFLFFSLLSFLVLLFLLVSFVCFPLITPTLLALSQPHEYGIVKAVPSNCNLSNFENQTLLGP